MASHSFSAWSRGVEVKPPAAAPHRMLQVGTSLSVTVQVGAAGTDGTDGATVSWSVGPSVPYSSERKRATSLVAVSVTAKE